MKAEIKKHIDSMRPDLLAYANYHAYKKNTGFKGSIILEEAIYLVTGLPEDQITEMYNKIARGKYRELDFYISKLIEITCEMFGEQAKKLPKSKPNKNDALAIQEATREERMEAVQEWRDFMQLCRALKVDHHD